MNTKGSYGIAKYPRTCPVCQLDIPAGARVARQRISGRFVWVHLDCMMVPLRLKREVDKLDQAFQATIVTTKWQPQKISADM